MNVPGIDPNLKEDPRHRCGEYCATDCDFCGKMLCRDGDGNKVHKYNYMGENYMLCFTCYVKELDTALEEMVKSE